MQAAGRLREPRTGHILAPRTTALQLPLHVVEVHAGAMTHVYRPYSIAIGVKSQSMCAVVLCHTLGHSIEILESIILERVDTV